MALEFARGQLLAQVRPGVTTPVTAFTAILRTEITLIVAIPSTAGAKVVDVYHDENGSVYDADSNVLFASIDRATAGERGIVFQAPTAGSGLMMKENDTIGVEVDTADEVNVMIYGHTETLAERSRMGAPSNA